MMTRMIIHIITIVMIMIMIHYWQLVVDSNPFKPHIEQQAAAAAASSIRPDNNHHKMILSNNNNNNGDDDICKSSTNNIASKFFILDELIFFTSTSQYFDTFRVFNVSSGAMSNRYNVSELIVNYLSQSITPIVGKSRQESLLFNTKVTSSSSSKVHHHQTLLWAFMYDLLVEHCLPQQSSDESELSMNHHHQEPSIVDDSSQQQHRYCSRVKNVKDVIVGRLSNQKIIYMRYNTQKFTIVNDANNFIEIQVLIKHLDRYGYTNSITFEQQTDQFVTTHYGRHMEICITKSLHQNDYIVPLPFIDELLDDDIFETNCYDSQYSYTSVIDLSGQLYAMNSSGWVDQIQLNDKKSRFELVQSNRDKLFFNCYQNSPLLGKYHRHHSLINHRSFAISESLDSINNDINSLTLQEISSNELSANLNDISRQNIADKSADINVQNRSAKEEESGSGFWSFIFTTLFLTIIGWIGYLMCIGKIDGRYWWTLFTGSISGALNGARQAKQEYKKKPSLRDRKNQNSKERNFRRGTPGDRSLRSSLSSYSSSGTSLNSRSMKKPKNPERGKKSKGKRPKVDRGKKLLSANNCQIETVGSDTWWSHPFAITWSGLTQTITAPAVKVSRLFVAKLGCLKVNKSYQEWSSSLTSGDAINEHVNEINFIRHEQQSHQLESLKKTSLTAIKSNSLKCDSFKKNHLKSESNRLKKEIMSKNLYTQNKEQHLTKNGTEQLNIHQQTSLKHNNNNKDNFDVIHSPVQQHKAITGDDMVVVVQSTQIVNNHLFDDDKDDDDDPKPIKTVRNLHKQTWLVEANGDENKQQFFVDMNGGGGDSV